MSSIAALEQLLSNDAALEQAQRSSTYARNTRQILNQPLSNFNTGSLRDPAGLPSLERLQGSIRVQQYMESGAIRHAPSPNPPVGNTATATVTPTAATTPSATATVNPATAPRNPSAPASIQLPTSAGTRPPTISGGAGGVLGVVTTGILLYEAIGDLARQTRNLQHTLNNEPLEPDPTPFLLPPLLGPSYEDYQQDWNNRRQTPGLLNPLSTPDASPASNPPRLAGSPTSTLQTLACSIFGLGCPTQTEGVPNLGSPGVAPPFYGGQSPGIKYNVSLHFEYDNLVQGGVVDKPNGGGTFYGPIGYPEIGSYIDSFNRDTWYIGYSHGIQNSTAIGFFTPWVGVKTNASKPRLISFSVVRTDGQPDTGGNLAPLPDAENRPATAPALANRTIPPPANAPTLPATTVPNPATTPIAPTPTPPPGTGVEDPLAPLRNIDPLDGLLPFLGLIPFLTPTLGNRFNPSGARQPYQGQPPATGTGDVPTPTCRYDSSNIAGRVDKANATLNFVELFMQREMMQKLDRIDAKIGPQIPGGGIAGFIKKTWDFLQIDRVLSILTWIAVLHNAYMLSNAIGQTLFSGISTALDAFGIEDAEGSPLDVGKIVGDWTEGFFKNIFGVETVDGIKSAWAKYNRIYQAAANILNSVQSMVYSMVEIMETISNYVGRIGNALQRSGAILQNSFNWMNPNVNYNDGKFFRFLQRVQDGVEIVEQIFSEVVSIQEEAEQLQENSEKFKEELEKEELNVSTIEVAARNEQKRPDTKITPEHEIKAEVDE